MRILLAEDNPLNQKIAARLLGKSGHEVVVASNGYEAVENFAAGSFDLILMDVQMPEMDGLEASTAIRCKEKDTGAHVPIIALTAHEEDEARQRCIDAGMDDLLVKPLKPDTMKNMLAKWVPH